jgi:tetratricopeptide (TPR) repeat protein
MEGSAKERKLKSLTIILLLTAVIFPVWSQPGSERGRCTVYRGYIDGDMEMWKRGIAELQEDYLRQPASSTLLALTEARYGYVGYLTGTKDKGTARIILDVFENDIERLAGCPEYQAEVEAFRLALLGFMMELNPARTVTLGPKAMKQLSIAMEKGSANPAVWIEKSNSESHMPAFAGGSKEKAAESLREALRLFESGKDLPPCNWRYLNTFVRLGQLLESMEDFNGARDAFLRALNTEPDFRLVRDELLPQLESKIK